MNGFEIAVVVFLAVLAAAGYTRGFARTMVGMAMLVFSLVATVILSGSVAEVFAESENVNTFLRVRCEEYLDEVAGDLLRGETDVPFGELLSDQEEMTVPFAEGGAVYLAELLKTEEFRTPVIRRMVTIAVNGVGALVTFILVRLAFFFIGIMVKGFFGSKEPGGFDRFLGMCFAVLRGILVIWLVMTVFRVFSFTDVGAACMAMIGESQVLSWLDEHNLVLAVLINVLRT